MLTPCEKAHIFFSPGSVLDHVCCARRDVGPCPAPTGGALRSCDPFEVCIGSSLCLHVASCFMWLPWPRSQHPHADEGDTAASCLISLDWIPSRTSAERLSSHLIPHFLHMLHSQLLFNAPTDTCSLLFHVFCSNLGSLHHLQIQPSVERNTFINKDAN